MHSSRRWVIVAACAFLAIGLEGSVARAAVPRTIAYQGKLTEADGTLVPPGKHAVTFRLYDAATGGAKLWEEQHTITLASTDNGVFTIVLGSKTPFGSGITFNDPLWLTIEIDGGEFTPRQPLSAVSYAINADTLDGLDSTQLLASAGAVDGASLTNLNASALTSGTVPDERLSANVSLLGPSIGAAELEDSAIQPGDIEVGDLPAHASTHQPGGADALATASAVSIGTTNSAGSATSLARADHVHQGVHSLAASGEAQLVGDVTLSAGTNVTLTQSANNIQIASTGGSAGNRASAFASSTVELDDDDTTLVSVTITKSQASSAILLIATVQLNNTSGSKRDTTLKLFRGSTQLDASYTVKHGGKTDPAGKIPITLHALDTTTATGSLTYTLKAKANEDEDMEATTRRLTAVELP